MSKPAKSISQLVGNDRVIVAFGARKQRNESTGEEDVIDPAKRLDVSYAYFLTLTDNPKEYNEATGYCKTISRKVKLLGLAEDELETDENGQTVSVAKLIPFLSDADQKKRSKQESMQLANEARLANRKAGDDAGSGDDADGDDETAEDSDDDDLANQ